MFGTAIVDWMKFDATGQTSTRSSLKTTARCCSPRMECVGARAPIAHRILWNAKDVPHRYKRLMMPLSADGFRVDMLLITSVQEPFDDATEFWRNPAGAVRY